MLYPRAPRENQGGKTEFGEAAPVQAEPCAQPTAPGQTEATGAGIPTACYSSENRENGPGAPHAARRVLTQVPAVDLGPELAVPKSWARRRAPHKPASPRPPRALPCPAPHSPLTLARAAEPGSGGPLRLPHALGPCATGRPGAGLPPGARSSGGRGGGGGAPLCQLRLRRVPSPRKVWRSEGWRPGGGGAGSPPCPALPAPGARPFPRESAPHRRGTDRVLMQMLSCLELVPRRVASPEQKEPEDRYHPQGLGSHTSPRSSEFSAFSLSRRFV